MGENVTRISGGEEAGGSAGREAQPSANELPSLPADTLFDLLGDCHRRAVLSYLEHTDAGNATLADLAAYVSQHQGPSDSPDSVVTRLHHVHLPRLHQTGLLEYDADANTVEYVGHPMIEACLDLVDGNYSRI